MAGIKQILQRRKAVANVHRITRTMKTISMARYKYYYGKLLADAEFHKKLSQAGFLLLSAEETIDHPLLKENSAGRAAVLAIGSGKGLCGSYNDSVYRHLEMHIDRMKQTGKKLDIYVTEGKLVGLLHYHNIEPVKVFPGFGQMPSDEWIYQTADNFTDQYIGGGLDYFGIVYMNFFSLYRQRAQTLNILPLADLIADLTTHLGVIWPWGKISFDNFYFSPCAFEVIEEIARMVIRTSVKRCFLEAILSEHVARMIVMMNATENAEEIMDELTVEYNRARQAKITLELLDIISGTGALA